MVLIDFGDVTSNATVKRGGRRLYRPPEVGGANYGPYLTEVGWSPPAWSYDVFSAGTFLLALGADPLPQDSMKLGRAVGRVSGWEESARVLVVMLHVYMLYFSLRLDIDATKKCVFIEDILKHHSISGTPWIQDWSKM